MIFDCDGVLVDSEPIANRVLHQRLHAAGIELPLDEVMARFIGKARSGCLELATELAGGRLPEGFAEAWDAALFAALAEVAAIEGVHDLLDALPVQYCAASNSVRRRVEISLRAAGLLRRFERRLFSAEQVARPKPAPDLFLHAARAMDAAPSRTVVVEDTVTGIRAAIAAGMKVLAYATDAAQHAALRAEGAMPFRRMSEVQGLLA